jgi:GNAT superfamily N-acetyltransferase
MVQAARQLYERTLDPVERIPWVWIERSALTPAKPGGWRKHLILAAPAGRETEPDGLAGYAYGAFIPGYGGYLCYVGVSPEARRLGVGTRLFDAFFDAMRADAQAADESLPFVVWESHRPEDNESLWTARLRLFDRAGGLWLQGVDFLAPNFAEEDGEPVPLQLFVRPMDRTVQAFGEAKLRSVVHGLYERVYRIDEDDALYQNTLTPGCHLRLAPALKAARPHQPA